MNTLEVLKEEHEMLEREIIELETIMEEEIINYSNLIHVLKKIARIWNSHAEKDEKIFLILEGKGVRTPLHSLWDAKEQFVKYHSQIFKALESGSDYQTREAMTSEGRGFISCLRNHITEQEWIFYALPAKSIPSIIEVESRLPVVNNYPSSARSETRSRNPDLE